MTDTRPQTLEERENQAHTIIDAGGHQVRARQPMPQLLEHAVALPLARGGDLLHRVEGLAITAFRDADDVVRHIYLNAFGNWVKA